MIPIAKNDKTYELVPEGTHLARVYSIVEIGHVPNTFPNAQFPTTHKVRITWELPEEQREFNGEKKPMAIGAKYTISLGEKSNLLPIIEGILGSLNDEDKETFDLKSLLGKTCLVSVVHRTSQTTGKQYAQVASTSKLPKGMKAPEAFNPPTYLDYGEGWDDGVYAKLPQFLKDDMATSDEMRVRQGKKTQDDEIDIANNIPF